MTEPHAPTLTNQAEDLLSRLPDDLERAYRMDKPAAHIGVLEEVAEQLTATILAMGDAAAVGTDDHSRFVLYEWLGEAKAFLLLLRDVLFEERRAQIMVAEERLAETDFDRLKDFSRTQVTAAAAELGDSLRQGPAGLPDATAAAKEWDQQRSPWADYRGQFVALGQQLRDLNEQTNDLFLAANIYRRVRELFLGAFERYLDYLRELEEELGAALDETAADEPPNATRLLRIVSARAGSAPGPETAADFIERLEALTKGLPEQREFIVAPSGGTLLRRSLNLRRATTSWLESELMSEVQDFYLRRGQIESRLQIALQTGESRLELSDEEARAVATQNIPEAMAQLRRGLGRSATNIAELEAAVRQHLVDELYASLAYDPEFLHLDLQQTFSQYRRYQRSGFQQIRDWLSGQWASLRDLDRESKREEALGFSERVVRLVRARNIGADRGHYTSLFLTKGYTGESFRVGREAELTRVAQIVDNWRAGFRGALLLTGHRMSGKTFFGELIAHRYFSDNFITLSPGVRLELGGRILEPTRDLKEAVDFVVRNAGSEPGMVWIDNLSNWRDEQTPLITDVQNLVRIIDYHTAKFFFVVATGTELHAQLQRYTDIDKHFQAILPMVPLTNEDIHKAIRIRHGATQTELLDAEGKPLTSEQFDRVIDPVYRNAHGNIGAALRLWAVGIEAMGEEGVRFTGVAPYGFPEDISPDSGLLLRSILLDRVTSDYQLRKAFGPAFRDRFQPLVQRMLSLGLLLRSPTGALEINPAVVNDIERLLKQRSFVLADQPAERPTV